MGLCSGGLIIGRIFASEIGGGGGGGLTFLEGLFLEGLIIGILRYLCFELGMVNCSLCACWFWFRLVNSGELF